jgi:hypothetical protein
MVNVYIIVTSLKKLLAGVYALIAAHLAQLFLNWHNDAFVLRQRLNFFGDGNPLNGALPPEALPAFLPCRLFRLFAAGLVLIITLKFNWCNENLNNELCDTDVSHASHAFGALGGLLTGLIFLRARSFKRPIHFLKTVLFMLVYGLSFCYIINKYFFETYKEQSDTNCPWIEYEIECQKQCYQRNYTNDALNCTVSICQNWRH